MSSCHCACEMRSGRVVSFCAAHMRAATELHADELAGLRARVLNLSASLSLIQGERCSNYFWRDGDQPQYRWRCATLPERTPTSEDSATRWCDACIAHTALAQEIVT